MLNVEFTDVESSLFFMETVIDHSITLKLL